MRALIVGCGYVGTALGMRLVREGHEVFGVRRDPTRAAELVAAGIKPLSADITRFEELTRLPASYDWVVNCVAASGGDAARYQAVYVQGMKNLVAWLLAQPPQKVVYTSSTGVYGQNDGSMVTETSPTLPTSETGKLLVEAERILLEAVGASGLPAVILRLAGIYGPGRGYWFRQFMNGEAKMEGAGDRRINMIHLDDVAGSIAAALSHASRGEIFNVVDSEPTTQREIFEWLAARLNRPLPPTVPEGPDSRGRRGVTNKRVDNTKLRQVLGYQLLHPSFREGFEALLEN